MNEWVNDKSLLLKKMFHTTLLPRRQNVHEGAERCIHWKSKRGKQIFLSRKSKPECKSAPLLLTSENSLWADSFWLRRLDMKENWAVGLGTLRMIKEMEKCKRVYIYYFKFCACSNYLQQHRKKRYSLLVKKDYNAKKTKIK